MLELDDSMEAEIRKNTKKPEKKKKEMRRPAPLPKVAEPPVKFDV